MTVEKLWRPSKGPPVDSFDVIYTCKYERFAAALTRTTRIPACIYLRSGTAVCLPGSAALIQMRAQFVDRRKPHHAFRHLRLDRSVGIQRIRHRIDDPGLHDGDRRSIRPARRKPFADRLGGVMIGGRRWRAPLISRQGRILPPLVGFRPRAGPRAVECAPGLRFRLAMSEILRRRPVSAVAQWRIARRQLAGLVAAVRRKHDVAPLAFSGFCGRLE